MDKIRALVTGGSRGIGLCIVKELIKNGYEVYAPTRAELDLSDRKSVSCFLEEHSDDNYGVLVNNAGINDINPIEDVSDSELDTMVQINMESPYMLLRGLIPHMKEMKFGKIVNIGSIWGVVSKGGRSVYSMTKYGIHGITKTLAVELAEYNILVNTVCPGFTLTELTRKNNTDKEIAEISQAIPMKRMAEPEEIARVVAFLVSNQNTYVTGQKIVVDGGYSSV